MGQVSSRPTPLLRGTIARWPLRRLEHVPFNRIYRGWNYVHGAIVTALVILAEFSRANGIALVVLPVFTPLSMFALYQGARRFHPDGTGARLPNMLTTSRVVVGNALLVVLALSSYIPQIGTFLRETAGFILVGALLLTELTDFFDGYAARRTRTGQFGATWDMESDSGFALALALGLRHIHGVGIYVLAIGLMKYVYALVWGFDGDPPAHPPVYKWFAKTVAAVVVTSLILGYIPSLGPGVRDAALMPVLALQLASFGWDLLLQRKSKRATE